MAVIYRSKNDIETQIIYLGKAIECLLRAEKFMSYNTNFWGLVAKPKEKFLPDLLYYRLGQYIDYYNASVEFSFNLPIIKLKKSLFNITPKFLN